MGACPAQTFSNVTPEKWRVMQVNAFQNSISLSGNSGQTTQKGFTFSWQYDAGSETLKIQCLDHPLFAPCYVINQKVQDLIGGN
jgi:hypothetical protein